ncbi:MAG: rhomboid family intramembrane serine protease [Corynebacterium sp.]|nr:rhomboid family intramembrane serine protease [Corynebacterium sp.]
MTTTPDLENPIHTGKRRIGTAIRLTVGFVVAIWGVFILDTLTGGWLKYYGIHPLDPSALSGIVTSPFLHADLMHLMSNTMPGAIFVFLIGLSGRRVFWEVTAISAVVGGMGTWLFGGIGTNHIGVSGLIYGWFSYLVIRGIANRNLLHIILGVILATAYSCYIWGVIPGTPGISWQGHLFGGIGGALAGWFITSDDTQARRRNGTSNDPTRWQ